MTVVKEYELMYKNEVVLTFKTDNISTHTVINEKYLPIGMQTGMSIDAWLKQRRSDKSRVSVRKLIATLKLNFGDDAFVSQFRKPTDFWWVRAVGDEELFETTIEPMYEISLNISASVPKIPRNFEVANIGSYEKGWRENQLVKLGNSNEYFSEILYGLIAADYMETAQYSMIELKNRNYICSNNFVEPEFGEYLVLADEWTHTGPEEMFEDWFVKYEGILTPIEVDELKKMHFLDVVLNNFDRHCQNFGFIYKENGERTVAPNFDFNLSIIGYNGLELLGQNEVKVEHYFDLFSDIPNVMKNCPSKENILEKIQFVCESLNLESDDYLSIANWIINRWTEILKLGDI